MIETPSFFFPDANSCNEMPSSFKDECSKKNQEDLLSSSKEGGKEIS